MKIIKKEKIYEQRAEHSKIRKYSEIGELLGIFSEVPHEIEYEFEVARQIKEHPEDYFEYEEKNGIAILTNFKKPDICSSIEIPETIKSIPIAYLEDKLFANNSTIEYVKLPSTIKAIGNYCFMACINLREIELSPQIKDIPKFCFHLCAKLNNINTENIENIYSNGFSESKIEHIDFTNTKFLGANAFDRAGLKDLYLPALVSADEGIFSECNELEFAKIGGTIKELSDAMFFNCKKLKSVKLENNVEIIGEHTFAFCKELNKINLENVREIKNMAFAKTNIEEDICRYGTVKDIFGEEK